MGALFFALLCLPAGVAGCGGSPAISLARPGTAETGPSAAAATSPSTVTIQAEREYHVQADLDGDGADESVRLGPGSGGVRIDDGEVVYRSRGKWEVGSATLGDTDRDGLPEVVALLEDEEGVHIGLLAWRGGSYRERLVTSPIVPRPTSLRVRYDAAAEGDVIDLGEGPANVSTYRWNGFGFTIIERTGAGR